MSQVVDFEVESPADRAAVAPTAPSRATGFWYGLAVGFFATAALALLIGLVVGLTTGGSPTVEDATALALTPELAARNWPEVLRRANGTAVRW